MYYFDNAATTFPKPDFVYETMYSFYREYGVNVGRGMYKEASIAYSCVNETRALMRDLFHVNQTFDVVFTPSATIALNQIIRGLGLKASDVVYISPFEHNAVLRTLFDEQEKKGFTIKYLSVEKDSVKYELDSISEEYEFNHPTHVFVTHASNAFGVIAPIKEIFTLAKRYNAITVCDFAQTAGLIDVSLIDSCVDYAVFAGHKTLYGPFGIGGIVSNRLSVLVPFVFGGTGIDSKNSQMPQAMPERYEAGSLNIQAVVGLNAALKWIKQIGIEIIREKEKAMTRRLLLILESHANIHIIRSSDENNNIGVVSCLFDDYTSEEIGQILSNNDIAVRAGLHCAPIGHEYLGTSPQGTVRFSVSYFTTESDIVALENALNIIEHT